MQVGGEMWRKNALYEIMDGKAASLLPLLEQDPELKEWRCKTNDECMNLTLLHTAVRFENLAALTLLLDNGAVGIGIRGKGGKTPLDWAISSAQPRMVQAMLDVAAAGRAPLPNLQSALRDAEAQVQSAERSGNKVLEATEVRDMLQRLVDEADRARREREAAENAAAQKVCQLLEEEVARAAKRAADAAAAAAATIAAQVRRRRAAEAQRRLEEEAVVTFRSHMLCFCCTPGMQ